MKKIWILFFMSTLNVLSGQTAEKIVKQHLESLGGVDKLNRLKAIQETRFIHLKQVGASIESTLTIDKKNGLKTELKASSVSRPSTEVFHSGKGYKIEGQQNTKLSEGRIKYLSSLIADFPSPLLGSAIEFLKMDSHDNQHCFVLKRSDGNLYWIRKDDFLLVKSKTNLYHDQLGLVNITTLYNNYQKVDGVLFSFEREIVEYSQRIEVQNITLNPELTAQDFKFSLDKGHKKDQISVQRKFTLPSPDEVPQGVFDQTGSYYAAVESMRAMEDSYKNQAQLKNFYYDLFSTNLANAGKYKEALKARDLAGNVGNASDPTIELKEWDPCNAIDEISSLADTYRAVFINEAHHVPQHRAFTHQLLKKLFEKGYRYFAAEALTTQDTDVIKQKSNMLSYLNEPEYADLIRSAVTIGYKIIPYEQVNPKRVSPNDSFEVQKQSVIERENAQAQNLKKKIFDIDHNAKILVHAGYDHILESEHYGLEMMAMRFKKITGINPLTIDQVGLMERGKYELSNANYRKIVQQINPKDYTILKNQKNEYWVTEEKRGKVDLQVIHPKTEYENDRPLWKTLGGLRKKVQIILPKSFEKGMAEVFVAGEKNTVPVDRIYLEDHRKVFDLYLPTGSFELKITNANGVKIYSQKINVNK